MGKVMDTVNRSSASLKDERAEQRTAVAEQLFAEAVGSGVNDDSTDNGDDPPLPPPPTYAAWSQQASNIATSQAVASPEKSDLTTVSMGFLTLADVELGDPRAAKPFEAVPRPAFVILWYAGYWTESEVYGGGETVAPGESLWVPTNNRMTYFGPFNGATRRKQAWEVRVHASTRSLPPMFVYHCDEDSVVSGAAREFVATARALGHTQVGCCFLERELQGMAGNHDAAPHFQKKTADTEPVSSTKNGGKLNVFSAATIEWMRHSGFLDARGKGQEENS